MNRYYNYENINLWRDEKWEKNITPINGLVQWMGTNKPINTNEFTHRACENYLDDPDYKPKTLSIDDAATVKYWADKGMRLTVLSQGGKRWISMIPEKVFPNREFEKIPALLVFHKENYSDPWWAMRTIEYYKDYNESLAETQDHAIIYLVTEGPDLDRIYLNIIQEAFVLYPVDLSKVYVDVGYLCDIGQKMSEIKDFTYYNEQFEVADPDAAVEPFGPLGIRVINIGNRWDNCDSLGRGLVMNYAMNEGCFDREWYVHSATGKKMMDGIVLEHKFKNLYEPELLEYWNKMGLKFESHEVHGERWTAMIPLSAYDEPEKKLPVVLIVQEVYRGNEHLSLTAKSYLYEFCEIAAQGECILLFFALEDFDSNDMFVEILENATDMYPIDRTRVYVTGHSHDGRFSRVFSYRHPELVTAVATLGNGVGLASFEESGNPSDEAGEQAYEWMAQYDMPLINIGGEYEYQHPVGERAVLKYINGWKRRLKSANCAMKSDEEIMAALTSSDKATRMIGAPCDRTQVIWMDGFDHYIGDVKNNDGKWHLRFVKIDNTPHTVTPSMCDFAWSFMMRFARDPETHEIIELM